MTEPAAQPAAQPAPLRWPSPKELLTLRCPVCWQAPMFKSPLRMHERCAACGHEFDRGNGYFLGAMFVSYTLVVLIEALVVTALRLGGLSWWTCLWIGVALVPVIGPLLAFPYSRLLWVTIERRFLHWGEDEDDALRAELQRRRQARDAAPPEGSR